MGKIRENFSPTGCQEDRSERERHLIIAQRLYLTALLLTPINSCHQELLYT